MTVGPGLDRARPRPGHRRRTGRPATPMSRPAVRPPPDLRHRRTARTAARRPGRHERRPSWCAPPGRWRRSSRTVAWAVHRWSSAATPGTVPRSSPGPRPKSLPPRAFPSRSATHRCRRRWWRSRCGASARRPVCRSPHRTIRRPTTATRSIVDGGLQIISPTDRDIESAIARAPHADEIARAAGATARAPTSCAAYLRARRDGAPHGRRRAGGAHPDARRRRRVRAGRTGARRASTDVHVVEAQFAPDPDFPTVAFPNPEEPGATDLLLTLAAEVRRRGGDRLGSRRRPLRGRRTRRAPTGAGGCSIAATKPVGSSVITCSRC